MHREPTGDRYASVASLTDADTVTAARLPLTVTVADVLPPPG